MGFRTENELPAWVTMWPLVYEIDAPCQSPSTTLLVGGLLCRLRRLGEGGTVRMHSLENDRTREQPQWSLLLLGIKAELLTILSGVEAAIGGENTLRALLSC